MSTAEAAQSRAELCSDLAEHFEVVASGAPAGWAGPAAVLEGTAWPEPLPAPKIAAHSATMFEARAVLAGAASAAR